MIDWSIFWVLGIAISGAFGVLIGVSLREKPAKYHACTVMKDGVYMTLLVEVPIAELFPMLSKNKSVLIQSYAMSEDEYLKAKEEIKGAADALETE